MLIPVDVVVIVGPTASGKTDAAVGLAQLLDGEVINGDAMQVYKGLDIGTAKITVEEMKGIPHHLFDIKSPLQSFSAAEYQRLVREKIVEIQQRGKLPIVAGGTGLYIQSVLYDYRFTESVADVAVRTRLEEELESVGAEEMHNRLRALDPTSAEKIHPNNHRRLVRALEIIEISGTTKAVHEGVTGKNLLFNACLIGLDIPRELLYERINTRVDRMLAAGLVEEVQNLRMNGVRDVQSVQAIGYKELYDALDGKLSIDSAAELIKKNTRRYAKRQMTYFKNKLPVCWLDGTVEKDTLLQNICTKVKEFPKCMQNKEGSLEEK